MHKFEAILGDSLFSQKWHYSNVFPKWTLLRQQMELVVTIERLIL